MLQSDINNRNFSTISPSAKSLLMLKGFTNIPFARQTAELIKYPEKFTPDFNNKDITFWARVVHFERRYWSIDQLLADVPVSNILELSSGFSFRGIEASRHKGVHYIDTDLPDVIARKKDFINVLIGESYSSDGKLDILPLNVFDELQFHEIVNHFPEGEIAIINEGLLMYLDKHEKEKLCNIIHTILRERGGYWITADVYVKSLHEMINLTINDETKDFYKQHNIEDNKFESFEEAVTFFKNMGFVIDKEADVPASGLSSIPYFLRSATVKQLNKISAEGKIQTTWRLKINDVS